MLRFLSYLVSSKRAQLTSIMFGRVGHTHGCLGALAFNLAIAFLCSLRPVMSFGSSVVSIRMCAEKLELQMS